MVEFLKYFSLVKVVVLGTECVSFSNYHSGIESANYFKSSLKSAGRQRKGFSQKREKIQGRRQKT